MQDSKELSPKERIADAAISLFTDKGFSATSVQDIVKKAGVNKAMLFYYFQTKENLFLYLIKEHFRLFEKKICESVKQSNSPADNLRNMFEAMMSMHNDLTGLAIEKTFSEIGISPEVKKIISEDIRNFIELFSAEIDRGIADGVFRKINSKLLAISVIGVMGVFAKAEKSSDLCIKEEDIRMFLDNFYLEGLRP